jgi:prophage DNA circulation protein
MNRWLLAGIALLCALPSFAEDSCDIEINRDITVSQEFFRVSDEGEPLYEVTQGGFLTVAGEQVELTAEQRKLTERYAGDAAAFVMQVVEMIIEALNVAAKAIEIAFTGLFGESSEISSKPAQALEEARKSFTASAKPEPGVYRLVAEEYKDFGEDLADEIEVSVTEVLGAVFSQIGAALTSGEGTFEEKMERFGARMDALGEEVEAAAEVLEDSGDELCLEMRKLRGLERELIEAVPELEGYGLFDEAGKP